MLAVVDSALLLIFPLFFMLFGLAALAFWIWMLIDCIKNEPSEGNDKLIWVLVIVLTNWIGALIYFLVRRPNRPAKQVASPIPRQNA